MVSEKLGHLLADNNLVFHRGVNAIHQQDDWWPRGTPVLRAVCGDVGWKLWRKLFLFFLTLELLKREKRNLLRLSVLQDREVLFAKRILDGVPGRICHHDIHLHQPGRCTNHRWRVGRTLFQLSAKHPRARANRENKQTESA